MSYPPQQGPPAWQPPPRPVPVRNKWKIAGIGCGGLVVLLIVLAIAGAIIGPPKKTASATPAAAATTAPAAVATAATTPPAPATTTAAAAPATKSKAPAKPTKAATINLARGAQHGLTSCVITYKDAQDGAGTSTFTALVVNKSGKPYSPTGSNPYSVLLQMNLTDTAGTAYPVTEALGNGSRTAADNPGGSEWFTTDQGDAQVSANGIQGVVTVTLNVPLAQMKSAEGNIMITSQSDENYLNQTECAVRPS